MTSSESSRWLPSTGANFRVVRHEPVCTSKEAYGIGETSAAIGADVVVCTHRNHWSASGQFGDQTC